MNGIDKHKVIIIGAGISGIKSSIDLTVNGVENIILESRNRLGGRLYTYTAKNNLLVDLGASWFHDCLVNPLLKKSIGKDNVKFYFDNGKSDYYNEEVGLLDANMKLGPVVDEINSFLSTYYADIDPKDDTSLKKAVFEYLKLQKDLLSEDQIKYSPQLIRKLELWVGSSWNDISTRLMADVDSHQGRDAFIYSGYQSVYNNELQELSELSNLKDSTELLNTGKIKLEKVVFNISFDDASKLICVSVKNSEGEVEKYYSEYLICSIPLSVLQLQDKSEKGAIEWSPQLPKSITSTLENITYSALGKVFFEFDEVFWPKDVDRFYCVPNHDKQLTYSVMNDVPLSSKYDKLIDPNLNPDGFNQNVLFLNLHRCTGKPLIGTIIASPLTEYVESNSSEKVWEIFKPILANISGLKPEQIKAPKQIVKTNWTNDPYARGSYIGTSVGDNPEACKNALIEAKDIFDGKGRVRFVGEALIDEGEGCAHGAWLTAEREVKKLLKIIHKPRL